jgi:hypothetical protein
MGEGLPTPKAGQILHYLPLSACAGEGRGDVERGMQRERRPVVKVAKVAKVAKAGG